MQGFTQIDRYVLLKTLQRLMREDGQSCVVMYPVLSLFLRRLIVCCGLPAHWACLGSTQRSTANKHSVTHTHLSTHNCHFHLCFWGCVHFISLVQKFQRWRGGEWHFKWTCLMSRVSLSINKLVKERWRNPGRQKSWYNIASASGLPHCCSCVCHTPLYTRVFRAFESARKNVFNHSHGPGRVFEFQRKKRRALRLDAAVRPPLPQPLSDKERRRRGAEREAGRSCVCTRESERGEEEKEGVGFSVMWME